MAKTRNFLIWYDTVNGERRNAIVPGGAPRAAYFRWMKTADVNSKFIRIEDMNGVVYNIGY